MRLIPLYLLFALATAAQAATVQVQVGVFADHGRHAVAVDGVRPDLPGLEPALARLLGCPVERSFGGFRCRERTLVSGWEFSGKLDFGPLLSALELDRVAVAILMPESPLTRMSGLARAPAGWWARRAQFTGEVAAGPPLSYRLGFSIFTPAVVLASLVPVVILLPRLRDRRWPWIAVVSLWALLLGATGALGVDSFFWQVPSVEGAWLRFIGGLLPLLLVAGQFLWLRIPAAGLRVWAPLTALLIFRPRSAPWMTTGETMLADFASLALFALVSASLAFKGFSPRALLPEPLPGALQSRLRHLGGAFGFDVRLDRAPAPEVEAAPRHGRAVIIPAAWLERASGAAAEAAVLLGCARTAQAPIASVMTAPMALWVAANWMSPLWWAVAFAPPLLLLWFEWCERRWERRIAGAVLAVGERPAVLRRALEAMSPEWGPAAGRIGWEIDRLAAKPATIESSPRASRPQ